MFGGIFDSCLNNGGTDKKYARLSPILSTVKKFDYKAARLGAKKSLNSIITIRKVKIMSR